MLGFFIMAKQYTYQGMVVTQVAVYGGQVVMVELPTGKREAVPMQALESLKANTVVNADNIIGQATTVKTSTLNKEESPVTVETEQAIIPDVEYKLNINTANQSEIADLKGVGRSSAKKIIANRPVAGYVDIEQLQGLNSELTRLDWDVVAAQITFS